VSSYRSSLVAALIVLLPALALADRLPQPTLRAAIRAAWSSHAALRSVRRQVRGLPEAEATAKLSTAKDEQRHARAELVAALRRTAPIQILSGMAAGPRDTWQTVRQHPFKVIGATALIAVASAGLELLSLPAQPIMLGACALLTLRALKQGYPEVRAAFRKKAPDRYRVLGERMLFPSAAYAAATAFTLTIGGAVESLSGSHVAAEGSKGLAYGIHIIDDVPSIAASLGGSAGSFRRSHKAALVKPR